jgi:Na+-transporting NADH:ubiquinone oxidoreductase subunit NqrF
MPKITILPIDTEVEVTAGSNLRTALIENGVVVKSPCGGHASCSQCIIVIKEAGEEAVNPVSFEEQQLLGNVYHLTSERLSCQVLVADDITVDVSNHMDLKTKVKTHRRTKEEAKKVVSERQEKSKAKPKKQGGQKRPKSF